MIYIQRIFDTSLNQYVYYSLGVITATPNFRATSPNHGGLIYLLPDSHSIISTLGEGSLSVLDDGSLLTSGATSIDFTGGAATVLGDAVTVAVTGGVIGTQINAAISTANDTPTTIYSYTPTGAGLACSFQFEVIGTGIGYKSHFIMSALATTDVSSVVALWDVYYLNGPYYEITLYVDMTATNPIVIRVTGIAGTTINWRIVGTVVENPVGGGGDP